MVRVCWEDRKLVEAKLVALHRSVLFFEDQCGFYAFFADFIRDLTQNIGIAFCAERDVEMDKQKKKKRKYNCCCIGWILIYAFNEIKGLFYYVRLLFQLVYGVCWVRRVENCIPCD